jgi:4-hydroxy-3-methylbut-2-enyl diphosphate reductase
LPKTPDVRFKHVVPEEASARTPASIEPAQIRHRDPKSGREVTTRDWLPAGPVVVGVSAGASTPDSELAEVVRRLCAAAGAPVPDGVAATGKAHAPEV